MIVDETDLKNKPFSFLFPLYYSSYYYTLTYRNIFTNKEYVFHLHNGYIGLTPKVIWDNPHISNMKYYTRVKMGWYYIYLMFKTRLSLLFCKQVDYKWLGYSDVT